jgi:hypothetical protein
LWPWIAASLAGLVGFEFLRHWTTKTYSSLRHRWLARRALRGEAHAEDLLVDAGYRIVERQAEGKYLVQVDGRATRVVVRADLLVQDQAGRTLVAEVKTGREAPRIENSATRRQLLEYRIAFDVTGVLLVDAETDAVHRVHFPMPAEEPRRSPVGTVALAVLFGAALGFAGAISLAYAGGLY